MFLFARSIVEGGKTMLRLGICLANVVKPFQVHREVTNVKSGHLLVQGGLRGAALCACKPSV